MQPVWDTDSRVGVFGRFFADRRRRWRGTRGVVVVPASQRVVAEVLETRRLLASVSFSSGIFTLNADSTSETIYVYRVIETSPATDKIKF